MTDIQTHAPGCWSWGHRHYECAVGQIERYEDLLRQVIKILNSAHQTAMEQTLKARIPECGEFAGIAQDLDFVVATLLDWGAKQPAPQQPAAVDEAKETDLWRCTVCGRVGTVGRCCGEETRERANIEQLLAENERLRAEVEVWKASFEQAASGHATYAERTEQLAKVLSKILENEASDWKAVDEFGGYVLDDELREEARAALKEEGE